MFIHVCRRRGEASSLLDSARQKQGDWPRDGRQREANNYFNTHPVEDESWWQRGVRRGQEVELLTRLARCKCWCSCPLDLLRRRLNHMEETEEAKTENLWQEQKLSKQRSPFRDLWRMTHWKKEKPMPYDNERSGAGFEPTLSRMEDGHEEFKNHKDLLKCRNQRGSCTVQRTTSDNTWPSVSIQILWNRALLEQSIDCFMPMIDYHLIFV